MDISQLAIERARAKARQRGLLAEFLVGDVLELSEVDRLDPPYRTVFDVGCFHTFSNADRPVYADSLARVVEPGGVLHLLCFSEHTPGSDGPRRVTQAEIRQTFYLVVGARRHASPAVQAIARLVRDLAGKRGERRKTTLVKEVR